MDSGAYELILRYSVQQSKTHSWQHGETDTNSMQGGTFEQLNGMGNFIRDKLSVLGHIELDTARALVRGGTDRAPQPPRFLLTRIWRLLGG